MPVEAPKERYAVHHRWYSGEALCGYRVSLHNDVKEAESKAAQLNADNRSTGWFEVIDMRGPSLADLFSKQQA